MSSDQLAALFGADPGAGKAASADGLTGCAWSSSNGVVAATVGAEAAVPSGDGAADTLGSTLGLTTDGFSSSSLTTSTTGGTARAVLVFSNAAVAKEAVDAVLAALADVAPPEDS